MNQPALLALLAGVVRAVLGSQAREVLSNFVEAIMSYLYSVLAQVGDKEAFSEASQSWVGGNLEKLGVRSYSATEIVMGGEMAGMVVIGFEYDSVDAAMAGQAGLLSRQRISRNDAGHAGSGQSSHSVPGAI